ncbi:hypothetical protein KCU65_g1139, partial [Aureobasidium melanogenum]
MRRRRALVSSSAQPWWQNSSNSQGASGSSPTASISRLSKVKPTFYEQTFERDSLAYHVNITLFTAIVHISANNFLHDNNREDDDALNDDCEDNYLHHEYTYCLSRDKYTADTIDFSRSKHYIYDL